MNFLGAGRPGGCEVSCGRPRDCTRSIFKTWPSPSPRPGKPHHARCWQPLHVRPPALPLSTSGISSSEWPCLHFAGGNTVLGTALWGVTSVSRGPCSVLLSARPPPAPQWPCRDLQWSPDPHPACPRSRDPRHQRASLPPAPGPAAEGRAQPLGAGGGGQRTCPS